MVMSLPPDAALREADERIAWVLANPAMSAWLKGTLQTALDRDPVEILNEVEMLRMLLQHRSDAIVRTGLGTSDEALLQ